MQVCVHPHPYAPMLSLSLTHTHSDEHPSERASVCVTEGHENHMALLTIGKHEFRRGFLFLSLSFGQLEDRACQCLSEFVCVCVGVRVCVCV